jgi:hypothetical protein
MIRYVDNVLGVLCVLSPFLAAGLVALVLHFVNRDVLPDRDDARGGWGPNMSRISYSGMGGLIFTLASMAIFLTLPQVRLFFYLSLPLGIAVAVVLHFVRRD